MPYFNIVAAYNDDAGIYEWQGEAADYDDALRAAQEQAFTNNCPTAVAEGEEPYKMFDEEQASVMDVTADVEARNEAAAILRDTAERLDRTRHPDVSDWASERADRCRALASRLASGPLR
jgi:hypothetical protein